MCTLEASSLTKIVKLLSYSINHSLLAKGIISLLRQHYDFSCNCSQPASLHINNPVQGIHLKNVR